MIDYSSDFLKIYEDSIALSALEIEEMSVRMSETSLLKNCQLIIDKCYNKKAVFTVLITLLFYKFKHPQQDIRLHQVELVSSTDSNQKGFSGRSFDTKYITPNLKKLGLPSMAESGWLTRSLEQAAPYDLNFPGKISGGVKNPFLEVINEVEVNQFSSLTILRYLINQAAVKALQNVVEIEKLDTAEPISILQLVSILNKQFHYNYGTVGAAKLPMLAFHAIYQILLKEIHKFSDCILPPIGSYTASDKTSRTAGDIEVFNSDRSILEAIEIKLDIPIDLHMVIRAKEKIYKFSPQRYYILSTSEIKPQDKQDIYAQIEEIKSKHGCQLILNGVLHTLKYYFRLIDNVEDFIEIYTRLIESDTELKLVHKQYWAECIRELNKKE